MIRNRRFLTFLKKNFTKRLFPYCTSDRRQYSRGGFPQHETTMPRTRRPRYASMQFWPRKRAQSEVASVRSWPATKESNVLGFAGYKVGMTHAMIVDNRKTTLTKGESIFCPITVIECPPLKTASIRFYNTIENRKQLVGEIFSMQLEKELERSMIVPKKVSKKVEDIKDFDEVRLLVYTQPKATGIGKKKPDVFELGIGGKKEDQLRVAQEKLGKDITVKDVLKEGQQV